MSERIKVFIIGSINNGTFLVANSRQAAEIVRGNSDDTIREAELIIK